MTKKQIPGWAKFDEATGFCVVDPDIVYPMYLKELGYKEITQTRLEVARLCFTEDLYLAVQGKLKLRILKREKWKLSKYPVGTPLIFRSEYRRIRG